MFFTESITAYEMLLEPQLLFRIKESHHPLSSPVKFSVSNLVNDAKLQTTLSDLMAKDVANFAYSIVSLSAIIAKDMLTTQQGCLTYFFSIFSPLLLMLSPTLGPFYCASQTKLMLMRYQGKYDLAVTL